MLTRIVLLTALVAAGSPAVAAADDPTAADAPDARQDIVDIRGGRFPLRYRVLGWSGDAVVIRRIECEYNDASDEPSCSADLTVARGGHKPRHIALFSRVWEIGAQRLDVSYPDARAFILAERKALAELGPLAAGTDDPRPFGIRIQHSGTPIVLRKGGRTIATIGRTDIEDGGDTGLRGGAVEGVHRSPDGAWVAITYRLDFDSMDFYFTGRDVVVLPASALAR